MQRIGRFALIVFEIALLSALDPGDALRELSGRFCRWERLLRRCGLLRANDARADGQSKAGADHPASSVREFSAGDDAAHDCAAGLSDRRIVAVAESVHDPFTRSGRRVCFAIARAAWRLVSLVVVAANEIPVSLGNADFICDQPHPRSRHRAWQARSSIVIDPAGRDRDLRRVEFANSATRKYCERVVGDERCRLGVGDLGIDVRAACALSDADGHGSCDESPRGFRA